MPPKRDVSTQNLPWLPGTDLRFNTEANKLESVVSMCRVIMIWSHMVTMITYLRVIKNFEGAEEDSDSVAKTCNGLIFVGKEHATKSTKIYTPRKFLRVRYIYIYAASHLEILLFCLL